MLEFCEEFSSAVKTVMWLTSQGSSSLYVGDCVGKAAAVR